MAGIAKELLHWRGKYSPAAVLLTGWRERRIILRLARRQIEARYRGSMLGIVWSVIVPLLMLGVYTFVFSVIFQNRWKDADEPAAVVTATAPAAEVAAVAGDPAPEGTDFLTMRLSAARRQGMEPFALVLFTGLILFNLFAECVNRSPGLMLENVTYIKKVIFPLESLAWMTVLVALFNALVSGLVLLVGYLLTRGLPPPAALLLPLFALPLILLTVGLSWFLSSLGVYFRDLQQFIPVLTTILMFLSPIFYPRDAFPAALQPLNDLNPIGASVEAARAALFKGQWPDWTVLAGQTLLGWLIAWVGLAWFRKTRKGFADVV